MDSDQLPPISDDHPDHHDDIYRGTPHNGPPSLTLDSSTSTTSSSSSSSSDSLIGRRLGAIAAVVELAISRWARGHSSALSSSSSASFSSSSLPNVTRTHRHQRRRRRPSAVTFRTTQSDLNFAAHVNWIKAREESRQTPRGFELYLPPPLRGGFSPDVRNLASFTAMHQVLQTSSLPLVISRLEQTLKGYTRGRHNNRGREKRPNSTLKTSNATSPLLAFNPVSSLARNKLRKGKQKDLRPLYRNATKRLPSDAAPSQAWYLDVASPTWDDMREIGRLLSLHPLTLEDILQREPREKLELFPRLGYYFVSFRAIVRNARYNQQFNESGDFSDVYSQDGGPIGEANIYLIVFSGGICSFHFTDISEHTDRVRNRIVSLEETANMSSDWIAHGILDSIVDSFFPLLEEIETEVASIDNLVFRPGLDQSSIPSHLLEVKTTKRGAERLAGEAKTSRTSTKLEANVEGSLNSDDGVVRTQFLPPSAFSAPVLQQFKRFFVPRWSSTSIHRSAAGSKAKHSTLRRIARTRRLVTSLTRLLAAKSEVIAQIRKRLLTSAQPKGLSSGTTKEEDVEVAMYMGDIQDHILTLQHSLAHYERMLSQSHPMYLSQLRTNVAQTKGGSDKAIMCLTIITVAVLCIQTLIGLFSLNVTVPHNRRDPSGRYDVFGVVLVLAIIILCSYAVTVRRWWIRAKRRRYAVL